MLDEEHSLDGALAAALASSEAALRRQEVGALLARDSEQLLCASSPGQPGAGGAPAEHSSDLWELARLRLRTEKLTAENDALHAQLRLLTAKAAEQESAAQVLQCSSFPSACLSPLPVALHTPTYCLCTLP
jgi:hypothetical protein